MRRFHLRGAPPGEDGRDVAIPILPAQEGILVLRHAHPADRRRWIRAQSSREEGNKSEPAESGPITVANNEEFAALLAGQERGPTVEAFVDKYLNDQRRVELEGFVVQVYNSDYDQQDALVQAGTSANPTGPRFNIGAYYRSDLAFRIEKLRRGQSVVISGELGVYEHDDSHDTYTTETKRMRIQLVDPQVEVLR